MVPHTFFGDRRKRVYTLVFKGINYRAEVWLNGHLLARASQAVGMYNGYRIGGHAVRRGRRGQCAGGQNDSGARHPGRGRGGAGGQLARLDQLEISRLEYGAGAGSVVCAGPECGDLEGGVPEQHGTGHDPESVCGDRSAGSRAQPSGAFGLLRSENHSSSDVSGTLRGEISRPGKASITFEKAVSLDRGETREVALTPADFSQLSVAEPDLWWPYQWGKPNLYHLKLDFQVRARTSDTQEIDFGIRKITQARDSDQSFPAIGKGGSFYLKINGRDYLIRGGVYSPDLLYKNDPEHDAEIIRYVKDLGLNLLRWESKIADESMMDLADREGIPTMFGWMCCVQWEHWDSWTAEDQWVARASTRATMRNLRSHASVVAWANGSDGLPPDPLLNDYNQILKEVHWQNAVLNTVSSYNRDWSGIHMYGPYVWRPPYFWFSEKYGNARGSSAEEGDNETIPPVESLKKFIPAEKLWPINEYWYFHSGANEGNNTLENVQRVLNKRYGPSQSVEEFSKKAQLAHYEDVRAQYEAYATHWENRKMLVHWMMNNPWPSLFGHLFDYYLKQGGGYFGAKKGLRPLAVVWDYYATGDRKTAKVYAVNLTQEPKDHLKVSVEIYNLEGNRKFTKQVKDFHVGRGNVDRGDDDGPRQHSGPGLFRTIADERCQRTVLAENVYWASKATMKSAIR